MIISFGKYRDRNIEEIPDTYLDWLLGEKWFLEKYNHLVIPIAKELALRKRSDCHIRDDFDKTLEEDEPDAWKVPREGGVNENI